MLTRWDPFREMMTMRRAVDRLMDSVSGEDWSQAYELSLAVDVIEDENGYQVRASVPGIKPEDLEITYDQGLLTVKGEIKDESETTKGQYHVRERRYGKFMRTISLPATVKADDIQASYEGGILTLKMPKVEEVKPRRIQILSNGQKMINAKSK